MKKLIKWAIALMLITMIINSMPTEAEGDIYSDTIRLHILANSDSTLDQSLKLSVRDELLTKYGSKLKNLSSIEAAEEKIKHLMPNMKKDIETWLSERGFPYSVDIKLGSEWYETRDYGDFSLPAGKYLSLQILLGRAEGQNWWCVMYPPLCLDMASEAAPADDGLINYTNSEISLINQEKYNIKFKILEELSRAFSKNS